MIMGTKIRMKHGKIFTNIDLIATKTRCENQLPFHCRYDQK